MTTDIIEPLLWALAGAVSFLGIEALNRFLKVRRRQKAKPWRRSKEAPKLPVAHQQKTRVSLGKSPVRKSRARIGTHHKTNR